MAGWSVGDGARLGPAEAGRLRVPRCRGPGPGLLACGFSRVHRRDIRPAAGEEPSLRALRCSSSPLLLPLWIHPDSSSLPEGLWGLAACAGRQSSSGPEQAAPPSLPSALKGEAPPRASRPPASSPGPRQARVGAASLSGPPPAASHPACFLRPWSPGSRLAPPQSSRDSWLHLPGALPWGRLGFHVIFRVVLWIGRRHSFLGRLHWPWWCSRVTDKHGWMSAVGPPCRCLPPSNDPLAF